jgi:hypothetical protein
VGGHPSFRGPLVVGRLVLAFVFVFVRDIGAEIGADGCGHGRTHLAWLSEHSRKSGEGGHRVRGPRPFALVVSFGSCTGVVRVRQCLCSFCVFRGCRSPKKNEICQWR